MIKQVGKGSRRESKAAKSWRAFLNGEDVTRGCYFADDRAGIVRVYYRHDDRGFVHGRVFDFSAPAPNGGRWVAKDANSAVRVEMRGKVRLERLA